MNTFDIIIVIVVGFSILRGAWRGLIRQIIGLVGVAAGYIAASHYYGVLATRFLPGFSPMIGHIAAFLAILIACTMAASILGWAIAKPTHITGSGIFNKISGGLLGAVKGCFIVAVATMALIAFLPLNHSVLKNSRTLEHIQPMARFVSSTAPKSIKARYDDKSARMARSDKEE
jgi:membrane protein required for colicin V production